MTSGTGKFLGLASCIFFLAAVCQGATIKGSIKSPDGAPFKGAFVEAYDAKTGIIVHALSDRNGKYRVENLPAGEYELRVKAIGYQAAPRRGVRLAADQDGSFDFALQKGTVRWTDLSNHQGRMLLPDGEGKAKLTTTCFACHGFQTRMAAQAGGDEDIWRQSVKYMRTSFGYFLRGSVTDQDEGNLVTYMTKLFGPESTLPKSPADLPDYAKHMRPEFSDEAMNIVYVSYPLLGNRRFPGAARPERDGNVWIWTYNKNRFSKLDPKTGKVTEYTVPDVPNDQAAVHAVVMAPNGSVWFTEQAENVIGKLDPATGKITKYLNNVGGTQRHSMEIDAGGVVYATGAPLASFDPKTGEWTNYPEVPSAYGIAIDEGGNAWFSEFVKGGKIGKIDAKTRTLTKYTPPSPDPRPRRLKIDSKGIVWFAEYAAGKIASFDPKTEKFKEYALPGASPTPYALTIDKKGHIWYSSMDLDIVGELDPATGKVTQYPFPYAENGMRDFFVDSEGRIWWGSQPNDRVGYFYLAGSNQQ